MKTKRSLLLLGALASLVASARAADMRPMTLVDLTGQLEIHQPLPGTCDTVDLAVPVVAGQLHISPGEDPVWEAGQRVFVLGSVHLSFAPFTVHRECMLQVVTRNYSSVEVSLSRAVIFRADPAGPDVYQVVIPKEEVLIQQAVVVNGQLETSESSPMEDVTGTIDFNTHSVQMLVKVASEAAGHAGTLTATLAARIVSPDYDQDGYANDRDNCRLVPNPDQAPVASPVILAPPDRTLYTCADRDLELPAAADICRGGPVSITSDAPPAFPVGSTVVTWQVTDGAGGTATAAQNITVIDRTLPVFTALPPNVSLSNCGPASLGLPTAEDDCDATPGFTNDAPSVFPTGATAVSWRVSDDAGNQRTATAPQIVTVTDLVKPSVSCVGQLDPHDPPSAIVRATAADACLPAPVVTFGSYALANGEVFRVVPSSIPGIVLLGVGHDGLRLFRVGPGAGVVRATDASGNVRTAACVVSPTQGP